MASNTLHQMIALACKLRKISILELERQCDLSEGTIKNWKKNSPSGETVAVIAKKLNISMDYLYSLISTPDAINRHCHSDPVNKIIEAAERNNISMATANIAIKTIEAAEEELRR